MKFILEKLGLIRPVANVVATGRHMSPWHPLFYKAVTFHIQETTATRKGLTR